MRRMSHLMRVGIVNTLYIYILSHSNPPSSIVVGVFANFEPYNLSTLKDDVGVVVGGGEKE
jgi:hypothetical protein